MINDALIIIMMIIIVVISYRGIHHVIFFNLKSKSNS